MTGTSFKLEKKLFDVEAYYKMLKAGILTPADRVELIHGEIIEMTPIGSRQASYVKKLNKLLNQLLEDELVIGIQDPIRLTPYSEPEPDLAILKARADFYAERHPTPEDILFLIEVADTLVGYDYDIKLPLYVAANIQEVWVLNINEEQITQHTQPDDNQYLKEAVFRKKEVIRCKSVLLELAMDKIF